MANSALTSVDSILVAPRASLEPRLPLGTTALAAVPPGQSVIVTSIELEPDLASWLHAVGIGCGERVTVLRRAAFGGPVHVRTDCGGEFAIAGSLARAITTS